MLHLRAIWPIPVAAGAAAPAAQRGAGQHDQARAPRGSSPAARESGEGLGKLIYDSSTVVDFDDRLLAHLQVVITAKLRRGESFTFSWRDDASAGYGRTTIWLHPSLSLVYRFHGSRSPTINRLWVEALFSTANSAGGLRIVPEPAEGPPAA